MNRLIDANALKRHVVMAMRLCGKDSITQEDVEYSIDHADTVDAVEVVHGRWEQQQGLYSCSECGKTCPYDVQADAIMYWTCNYCPNCGAKMDGERRTNGQ